VARRAATVAVMGMGKVFLKRRFLKSFFKKYAWTRQASFAAQQNSRAA
jgi:hypothetical protein